MSEHDPHPPAGDTGEESFLGRWSRLKAKSRERETSPAEAPEASDAGDGDAAPAVLAEAPAEGQPPAVELPDLELLDQDSDYSAFLTPGVDAALRKRALRKLFSSPKFNVFDGLDTYRDDFTGFPALGAVVTADMRHHLERIARELAARTQDPPPAAPIAPLAPEAPADRHAESHERPAAQTPPRTDEDANAGPA